MLGKSIANYLSDTSVRREIYVGNPTAINVFRTPKGRSNLVVGSRPWGRELQVRNPIPLKIRRVWDLLHAKSYVVAKRPPVGVAWKFSEGVPAQVSSSSSDRGSKLQGPSQNSPRVASKRGVNITKLKPLFR
ncbi:hypothetical protein AVEN_223794-1 [Araneus ventricosus]|uniref:Uncharacterized protein n=1 Tax=Araneus ventricosus TaxID=182803 RepID=A0A4Y2DNQ1_ARAVE|nr:hypothetical protein AVEN_223794-1 [Araneus ventricosus]